MNNNSSQLAVLAGGPGVGKSTLLDALQQHGFPVIKEAATSIMRQTGVREPWLLPASKRNEFRKSVVGFDLPPVYVPVGSRVFG